MLTHPPERSEWSNPLPTDRTLIVRMIWAMLGVGAVFYVVFDVLRRAVNP
jgi:hypothetical protein